MGFPRTLDELKAANYKFLDHGECRGCGDAIEWYETPTGKKIPMNPMHRGSDEAIPHWKSCTEQDSFRKD